MWQRFTQRARQAVFFAQEDAGRLGENCVSTEHLLLGLVRETDNTAARVLELLGVSSVRIRDEIERRVTRGDGRFDQDMQLTLRAKQAIDLAMDEARQLNNDYVGTEHLLLGLIREGDGIAGRTLAKLGVDYDSSLRQVVALQGEVPAEPSAAQITAEAGFQNLNTLRGRDLLSINDLSSSDIGLILDTTSLLKTGLPRSRQLELLPGKTLAMIFEKPSLRTRVTFEAGMSQLGGHAIYLGPQDAQIGKREPVADAASNLARWVDGIMARTFAHATVAGLAEHASVPVLNGLSDLEHPCQALADFYTIKEKKGGFEGLKLAYIGDGNNVCNSLMLLSAKLGVNFSVACPEGYEPDESINAQAAVIAGQTGAVIEIVREPVRAAKDADALYTDVWASMGQEQEAEERQTIFASYQVNQALVNEAKDDVIVLHCLPAHRGDEITVEVIDGPHSVVVDEAENRLHVQKALLVLML